MRSRLVEPEILDSLPHDHPDALVSRGDIRFLNTIMGSFRWIRKELGQNARPGEKAVELGAGDGGLVRYVAQSHPELAKRWAGLDFAPAPPPGHLPEGTGWLQGDFLAEGPAADALRGADVVVANLILHHFQDDQLALLGRRLHRARLLVISEPARHPSHLWKGRLLNAILGFNYVTMFDMARSIQAGFRVGELPKLLRLDEKIWTVRESMSQLGAYRLVAERALSS
ncbi:class I SAM-dependent methyltransferase [Verrucomicrobium sp. BvORR106]|uniref:class I SAM-dependent methyltransferase n=1 Tax=Verrucomicrobium sp. BvORR106 TaxID=1403819 RepID=UPI00057142FA|nr:class I SAM-dependent methyltransferase [Verrucomicrobium sp. BvORR106]